MGIQKHIKSNLFLFVLLFVIVWIPPILYFDSVHFAQYYYFGKAIALISLVISVAFVFSIVPLRLKLLIGVMIPLSWLGEVIFSDWLGMYHYREGSIPFYVPFGHASVFIMGWLMSEWSVANKSPQHVKKWLTIFYLIAFSISIIVFHDTLSLLFGVMFFVVLKRKDFLLFYLITGLIVYYLEIIGTSFGAWRWDIDQGPFTTINPPIGAIFIYVGGDLLLTRIVRYSLKFRRMIKS